MLARRIGHETKDFLSIQQGVQQSCSRVAAKFTAGSSMGPAVLLRLQQFVVHVCVVRDQSSCCYVHVLVVVWFVRYVDFLQSRES